MDQNKKIAIVLTGALKKEGISSIMLEYLKAMDKRGIDFFVIASGPSSEEAALEFTVLGCKVYEMPNRKTDLFKYILCFYKTVKKENFDIIHVNGSSALLSIELLIGKIGKVKIRVAHSHNTTCEHLKAHFFLKPLFNKLYTDAFACGEDAGKWLFKSKAFTVIPNAKDMGRFTYNHGKREEFREKYNLNGNIVFGHVGAFNNQKNHKFLIEIFYRFKKSNQNCVLFLMGEGFLMEEIREQVNMLGISDSVIFTGNVADIEFYLQGMDIMLFPSKYEGLPNVVLEWQSMGLPAVISDSITSECIVSDLVYKLSLNTPFEIWIQEIECVISQSRDRVVDCSLAQQALKDKNFDIVECSKSLRRIYFKL